MMGTVARNVVSAFAEWAQGRPGIEPDVVETLVDLTANYLDDAQPTRWRSGDLTDLLLELVPAQDHRGRRVVRRGRADDQGLPDPAAPRRRAAPRVGAAVEPARRARRDRGRVPPGGPRPR